MMTMEHLGTVLASQKFTEEERWIISWQFRLLGDFQAALALAITKADDANLENLARGFPMQVGAYLGWSRGCLGNRLRQAGIDV